MICGKFPEYPKTSGSHNNSDSTPNSSLKNLLPCRNWRIRASPPLKLVSASTHMAPSAIQRPCFTFCLIRWIARRHVGGSRHQFERRSEEHTSELQSPD